MTAALPAQAAPGLQFAELRKRHLPFDRASAIAFGDVDGDGDLDLVVHSEQTRLCLNDGHGIFTDVTASRLPAIPDPTTSVALGDVDGDGDLDLVVGTRGQNRLYVNDGIHSGTFTDVTATRLPVFLDLTSSVALGDVDGDGDLDLVVGNDGDPHIPYNNVGQNRLHLNSGSGTFHDVTATRMPAVLDATSSVALGDVDGDDDLDLIVGNNMATGGGGGQNRIHVNDGHGIFTDVTATQMPANLDATSSVVLGDVDGDGDLDLVVGDTSYSCGGAQNRLYLNDGHGILTDVTATRMPANLDATSSVVLGDVDDDGDLDLVVGNYYSDRILINSGNGTFADATTARLPALHEATTTVALGDVDGDGDLDLVVGSRDQSRLLLNNGVSSGAFVDVTATPLPAVHDATRALAFGDIDGDGDLDLVVGNSYVPCAGCCPTAPPRNRLFVNDGTGHFTDATATRLPAASDACNAVALGDVDGDGDLDLVVGNLGQNRLLLNSGVNSGIFVDATATQLPATNDATRSLALGDVDGDGDLDLIVGNGGSFFPGDQNRIHLNDGHGIFTDHTATRLPAMLDATTSVALGDVDGDGDLDLVVGNDDALFAGAQNRLYLNDGVNSGSFSDVTATRLAAILDQTTSVALGDVDGDGDLDLVVGDLGQNRILLNSGVNGGMFTDVTATRFPAILDSTNSVALGDVDGDGDLDLIVGNGNGGSPLPGGESRVHLNDGHGTFTDVTATRLPAILDLTSSVALGDVDADGDLDLALGSLLRNRLLLNLQRQLDAPFALRPGRRYALEAYSRYGPPSLFDMAQVYVSTARVHAPLPPHGILGIDPMIALLPIWITGPAGVGGTTWNVPNVPHLAGVEISAQGAMVHWPSHIRLTGVTSDAILQ